MANQNKQASNQSQNQASNQSENQNSQNQRNQQQGDRQQGKQQTEGTVLDNVTYNIITVLHEKSKGLEAYEKYLQDASSRQEVRQVFEEIRQRDQQSVQRLQECLREVFAAEGGSQSRSVQSAGQEKQSGQKEEAA